MITNEHVSGYIKSFEPDLPPYLSSIEKYGINHQVPIIKKDAQSVLRFVLKTYRPINILEIGAAIGFSACYMAEYMSENSSIDTIEKMPERITCAKKNFAAGGHSDRITLYEGDAEEILRNMVESGKTYDFVFLDAAKAQYCVYLRYIAQLLSTGGILLTDNILQEGSVAQSKFSVTRRDRTIHLRMREFISVMMNSKYFESVIIPVGDGMLLSYKTAEGGDVF